MTKNDVTEMKKKLEEYEQLEKEIISYTKLISYFEDVKSITRATLGVPDIKYTVRLTKAQVDKLVELLSDFRTDTETEMKNL